MKFDKLKTNIIQQLYKRTQSKLFIINSNSYHFHRVKSFEKKNSLFKEKISNKNACFETGTEVIVCNKILFYFLMQQVFALQLHLKTAEIKFAMQGPCSNASNKHECSLFFFLFQLLHYNSCL